MLDAKTVRSFAIERTIRSTEATREAGGLLNAKLVTYTYGVR
jgi:hypothetical protein